MKYLYQCEQILKYKKTIALIKEHIQYERANFKIKESQFKDAKKENDSDGISLLEEDLCNMEHEIRKLKDILHSTYIEYLDFIGS